MSWLISDTVGKALDWGSNGLLDQVSSLAESLCCVLEQDTLSSALSLSTELLLIQPRKTRTNLTEKSVTWIMDGKNQNKQLSKVFHYINFVSHLRSS